MAYIGHLRKKWYGRAKERQYPDENHFIDGRTSDLQMEILHFARRNYEIDVYPSVRVRDIVNSHEPTSPKERRTERSMVSRSIRRLVKRRFLRSAGEVGAYNLTRFGWKPPAHENGLFETAAMIPGPKRLRAPKGAELEELGFADREEYDKFRTEHWAADRAEAKEIDHTAEDAQEIVRYRNLGIRDEDIAKWYKVKPEELDDLVAGRTRRPGGGGPS